MNRRDWVPVAPAWERNTDDNELWRRVTVLPSLALNRTELELLLPVSGGPVAVLGVGDGNAALALTAGGTHVTAIDPSQSLLDMLMIRARLCGVEVELVRSDLTDLSGVLDNYCARAYAAQLLSRTCDLGGFYAAAFRILMPGGRLVVNEYHPFRRIWKQESGPPLIAHSYFQHSLEMDEDCAADPTRPGAELGGTEYLWTIADHVHFITAAGFRVAALEEVGEVRQHWELPDLRGLPEQLILAADKPE